MNSRQATEVFIDRILNGNGLDAEQVARHEAGHRFMWRVAFPDVETHYGVKGGLPAVFPRNHASPARVEDMSVEEASRMVYVKMGGVASEILWLGLGRHVGAMAEWVAGDLLSRNSRIDWEDDAAHGGDFPQAANLILGKSGDLRTGLRNILSHAVRILEDERDAFAEEAAEARAFFAACAANGLLAEVRPPTP